MGEVFTVAGSFSSYGGAIALDPTRLQFSPSQGALVAPIGQLVKVSIDEVWWQEIGKHYWPFITPGQELAGTFLDLDSGIQEQSAAQYSDTPTLMRPEAFKSFVGVDNRTVTLPFQFRAQGLGGVDRAATLRNEVYLPAKWLDALKYPLVIEGGGDEPKRLTAPPPVILQLGSLLTMRAVVTDVTLTWVPPFDPASMLAHGADVAVTFVATTLSPGTYQPHAPDRLSSQAQEQAIAANYR